MNNPLFTASEKCRQQRARGWHAHHLSLAGATMQFHGLLSRASDLVEMGLEKGREMGEAAAKAAADTAKAAAETAKAAADTAMAASSKSVTIEERQYL